MSYLTPTLALIAIVGGMYFVTHLLRSRLGVGKGTVSAKALKIVGRRQLEPRKSLYVVEIADRYVLVGTAEGSVSLIDHITADEFARMGDEGALDGGTDEAAAAAPATGGRRDEERFATVAESFHHFLGKATSGRSRKRAGVEAAPEFELVAPDADLIGEDR